MQIKISGNLQRITQIPKYRNVEYKLKTKVFKKTKTLYYIEIEGENVVKKN